MKYKVISALCVGLLTVGMLQSVKLQAQQVFASGEQMVVRAGETEAAGQEDADTEGTAETAGQEDASAEGTAEAAGQEDASAEGTAEAAGQEDADTERTAETAEAAGQEDVSAEGTAEAAEAAGTTEVEVLAVQAEENEYADLAIANVTNYVNVRSQPNTASEILGKIYDGAVAQILDTEEGEDGQWFKIVSGNVEGYIKSEFFLYGEAAAAAIDDYVTRYAVVLADRLNVRENPDLAAKRLGYIDNGEKVKIVENQGDWIQVQYTDSKTGYVAAEYVTVSEEFVYAKTLEEEAAELAAKKELEARQHASEEAAAENVSITATAPSGDYSSNAELRSGIVEYAMQFLGNKYVHGGQSLETGTDCSGFTSLIYAQFGYSVSRTPSGQLSGDGRSVSYSERQPGDIICYGSGGKCTHVALYIGDGQIIHSANSKKGVVIYDADYDTILDIKNVID